LADDYCLKKTKFCPKCGSTNVFYASGLPQLWSIWDCRNCGYRGALILEDGKLAAKLRKEWIKKKA
jgi:DNA-directed RNA polymerase subunit M